MSKIQVWTPADGFARKQTPEKKPQKPSYKPKSLAPKPTSTKSPLHILMAQLKDKNPAVRRQASQKLGQMGESAKEAIPALAEVLRTDEDKAVIGVVAFALSQIGNLAVPALRVLLEVSRLRTKVIQTLQKIGTPEALTSLEGVEPQQTTDETESPQQQEHQAEELLIAQPLTPEVVAHPEQQTALLPPATEAQTQAHPPPELKSEVRLSESTREAETDLPDETQTAQEQSAGAADEKQTPSESAPAQHTELLELKARFAHLTGRAKWKAIYREMNRIKKEELTIADGYLMKKIRQKTPMVFVGYGMKSQGIVKGIWKYKVDVLDGSRFQALEKLHLVCCYKQQDAGQVENCIQMDKGVAAQTLPPIVSQSERFQLPDEVLETCHKNHHLITITLRTGHLITGKVMWFTPYNIGLMLKGFVKVMVFRHAIYGVRVVKPKKQKAPQPTPETPPKETVATQEEAVAVENIGVEVVELKLNGV